MTEKRIQFSNIVKNQLPNYVIEEFPLISEFLSQYYISQEFKGAPADLIQNIDKYVKIDELTNQTDSTVLGQDISFFDTTIVIDQTGVGIEDFPDSYGVLQIDDEIITYTGKTSSSFTGCVRGFVGITSLTKQNYPDQLVFSESESAEHTSGSVIKNLSSLFLKEFLLKTKYQLLPGLENRTLSSNINQSLFIKQAKDFYLSKGTDESFKILFNALYGESAVIIRPKDYLFRPSDANYRVTDDLVVERIEGDPLNLLNATLFQDEYHNISRAYAPIADVEVVISELGNTYYKLSLDSGYSRDIRVDGAIYGNFVVHSKTQLIESVSTGTTTLSVDSTVGFPQSGELSVTYNDNTTGIVSYSHKSLTQFFDCSGIVGIIEDKSQIGINTYAYANVSNELIKVRINSVIKSCSISSDTRYYHVGDTAQIRTLGVDIDNYLFNNWFLNIASSYEITSISLQNTFDYTYNITVKTPHIFKIGDSVKIINSSGSEKLSTISNVDSSTSFSISGQGVLSNDQYIIRRNLLKVNSNTFPNVENINSNVQNLYKLNEKLLISSSSIPTYYNQSLDLYNKSVTFSGTFPSVGVGSTNIFNITSTKDHGFYTGDIVYYIPEKNNDIIISSLFDEGIYYVKRIDQSNIQFAKSKDSIYYSNFEYVNDVTSVSNNKIELYDFK